MTRDDLLRELLIERFGRPVREYRQPAVESPPPAPPAPRPTRRRRRTVDDAVRRYEEATANLRRETA